MEQAGAHGSTSVPPRCHSRQCTSPLPIEILRPGPALAYFTSVRPWTRFGAATLVTSGLVWMTLSLGPAPRPAWRITHRVAAHRALVVEVEARHPEDAVAIARTIAGPERARFGEILVFVNRPGRRDMLRRVQWTPEHGYVQTVYGAETTNQKE